MNGIFTQAEKHLGHAFGRLKGQWRCLQKRNDATMQYIIHQTAACCVLHNLCEMQEEFGEDWRVAHDADIRQCYEDDNGAEAVRNTPHSKMALALMKTR